MEEVVIDSPFGQIALPTVEHGTLDGPETIDPSIATGRDGGKTAATSLHESGQGAVSALKYSILRRSSTWTGLPACAKWHNAILFTPWMSDSER